MVGLWMLVWMPLAIILTFLLCIVIFLMSGYQAARETWDYVAFGRM